MSDDPTSNGGQQPNPAGVEDASAGRKSPRKTKKISARAATTARHKKKALAKIDISRQTNRHKRLITSEEVAAVAQLLVSPLSESLNGQTYEIAGGQM